MRQLPGIDPGKLPVVAVLAAAAGFTVLLATAAAVYIAVDALGAVLIAAFLLASLGLAASGWLMHWRAMAAAAARQSEAEQAAPPHIAGEDSPTHRVLEAVAVEVKASSGTIAGFAELLPTPPEPGPAEAQGQLLAASRRLLGFASDLHDFIRFERGRLRLQEQQVEAGELLQAALASCRSEADAAATTIIAALVDGVELSCDAGRIRQALVSLVLWAVECSAPGGVLDVEMLQLPDGGLAIAIASRAEATGGAQLRERLFEPQLSVTGLKGFALPIARRVALLHGGEVTAASTPGEGTSARLTLPAQRVAWPAAEDHARAA